MDNSDIENSSNVTSISLMGFAESNVYFKHYSNDQFLKAKITEVNDNNTLVISPNDPYIICSYFEDDPVAIIFEQNDHIVSCQTYITKIDYIGGNVEVLVRQANDFSNRRQQNRYPTSIYATILGKYEMENTFINNISTDGLSLLSNAGLQIGEEIEIEAKFKKISFYFKAKVLWERELSTINEYGLANLGCDPDVQKIIEMLSKFSSTK